MAFAVLELARNDAEAVEPVPVRLEEAALRATTTVDTGDAEVVIEDDMRFTADTERLQTRFENLYRNALEHGPGGDREVAEPDADTDRSRGDITITVGSLPQAEGFYVADDGVGIPPGEREVIFDTGVSFAEEGGTGLGLTIVKQTGEAHGWTIGATSSETGGARFEIRF